HSQRTIEADRFAVQHLVLDNMYGERRVFRRFAETGRERYLLTQGGNRILRQSGNHGSAEWTRRAGDDAKSGARQIASDGQGHARRPALGSRIGRLADLTVEGSDRSGIDDDPAFAAFQRLKILRQAG